ncbi:MAG: hypothetical protein M3004_00275 [Bacteroidota bacterium]|nr:hypothetical protein [Bacteroidota bacterium]
MAKIIPLLKYRKKIVSPLTPLMIKTLIAACKKQSSRERFGQTDLKGSFNALLNREFIDAKVITIKGKKEVCWYVTQAGKKSLIKLGINEPC